MKELTIRRVTLNNNKVSVVDTVILIIGHAIVAVSILVYVFTRF